MVASRTRGAAFSTAAAAVQSKDAAAMNIRRAFERIIAACGIILTRRHYYPAGRADHRSQGSAALLIGDVDLPVHLVERGAQAPCELGRVVIGPEVHEVEARLLVHPVAV